MRTAYVDDHRAAAHATNTLVALPFVTLATVELQLIMQCCDAKTLLSFARCSRATLQAASTDFAWSRQPPFPVRSTQAELGARIRGSLLRHCDTALTWGSASGGSGFGMRAMFASNISVPEEYPTSSPCRAWSRWTRGTLPLVPNSSRASWHTHPSPA